MMVLPWYHTTHAVYCVCAPRACPSLPLERPVTPRASGMSDSLVDHSPCPRRALITPSGLSAVVRNDSPSSGMLDCPFSRPSVQASHQQCSPFHSLGFDPTWPLHTSCKYMQSCCHQAFCTGTNSPRTRKYSSTLNEEVTIHGIESKHAALD